MQRIVLDLGLTGLNQGTEIYQGWSWSGNDELSRNETGIYPWISAVIARRLQPRLGNLGTGSCYWAYTSSVKKADQYRGPANVTVMLLFVLRRRQLTLIQKQRGSETIEHVSTETTVQEQPSNCFYYFWNREWDNFFLCTSGINPANLSVSDCDCGLWVADGA